MKNEERKLIKFSNYSLCVTLPKSVVSELGWKKGDIVSIHINEGKKEIIIGKNAGSKFAVKTEKAEARTQRESGNSKARW